MRAFRDALRAINQAASLCCELLLLGRTSSVVILGIRVRVDFRPNPSAQRSAISRCRAATCPALVGNTPRGWTARRTDTERIPNRALPSQQTEACNLYRYTWPQAAVIGAQRTTKLRLNEHLFSRYQACDLVFSWHDPKLCVG